MYALCMYLYVHEYIYVCMNVRMYVHVCVCVCLYVYTEMGSYTVKLASVPVLFVFLRQIYSDKK